MSEYDPLLAPSEPVDDLESVQGRFAEAARPFLSSPLSWLAWAVVLPVAALATPLALARGGGAGVLFLWSGAVLAGGVVEGLAITRQHRRRTLLGAWALRVQGNLSLVALALSVVLVWQDLSWLLPGLWLLLLGHSLYLLGGLAFAPLATGGIVYQAGGVLALWPGGRPLVALAAATALGNLWIAAAIYRARRDASSAGEPAA
jgi:hypothetical protein